MDWKGSDRRHVSDKLADEELGKGIRHTSLLGSGTGFFPFLPNHGRP